MLVRTEDGKTIYNLARAARLAVAADGEGANTRYAVYLYLEFQNSASSQSERFALSLPREKEAEAEKMLLKIIGCQNQVLDLAGGTATWSIRS